MPEKYEYVWKTIEEVSTPPKGCHSVDVIRNMWWVTNADGKVCLFAGKFPQGNHDRSIALAMSKGEYTKGANGQIVQIPYAFVGHTCERY